MKNSGPTAGAQFQNEVTKLKAQTGLSYDTAWELVRNRNPELFRQMRHPEIKYPRESKPAAVSFANEASRAASAEFAAKVATLEHMSGLCYNEAWELTRKANPHLIEKMQKGNPMAKHPGTSFTNDADLHPKLRK